VLRKLSVLVLSAAMVLALAVPAAAVDYTVRSGDTLASIARANNVSGGWQAVYQANRSRIANPNVIRVGQVLTLPSGSTPPARRSAPAASRSATRSATSSVGAQVVAAARSQIGTPYRWGGNTPRGFDCSGLSSGAYAQAGRTIPRTSRQQAAAATRVRNPQPGDLVIYGNPVSHLGIYTGNGMMVHSSRPGRPVAEVRVYQRGLRGYYRP
jgi:cell wall-associated NlpC family hydrolase